MDKSKYLMDLYYKGSMNQFEECFGDNVKYSTIEQESYVDLKVMVFELINETIKFRKHERDGIVLTLKMELSDEEKEKMEYLLENEKLNFLYDFGIKDLRKFEE